MITNALNGVQSDIHLVQIRKTDKDCARKFNFKDVKLPVKIRDIHKMEKNIVSAQCFWL